MAQSQVRGLAFLNLVHFIISVRALEFKHMQIDTLALITISALFLVFSVRGINENEFQLDNRISMSKKDY